MSQKLFSEISNPVWNDKVELVLVIWFSHLLFIFRRGGKRKSTDSASELMKACIGFEDQNGKKVAITAASAVDFRPIISENSIISTHTAMVTTSKPSAAGRKTANVTENVSQSSNASRPVGKRRKSEF